MIQEQAILNVLHECGIRVGNYDENCAALLNEAKKSWQAGETHKPLMPFMHTNVLLTNDQNRGIYIASATIFFPFMLKIPGGTTRTTTTEEGRTSLLDVANENADFIEESVSGVELELSKRFQNVSKQGRSVFDVNFSTKYFGQADKSMLANFFIFAYVCDYQLSCEFQSNI